MYLAVLLQMLPCGQVSADTPAHAARAVWIWEADSFQLLTDTAFRTATIAFLNERGISTVYLYADSYAGHCPLVEQPQQYRDLIAGLRGCSITTQALLGSWHLQTARYILPEMRPAATAMLQRVLDYNAAAGDSERFAGVSFDIEPHQLDDWDEQRTLRLRQFCDLIRHFVRMRDDSDGRLLLGAAIPFWWDGILLRWQGWTTYAARHLQYELDYVALMDYRDHAAGSDGIIRHAESELAFADRISRQVVIGIETAATEPAKVTFYEEGTTVLERELALTEQAVRLHPSFAGFALHHLATYRALPPASR